MSRCVSFYRFKPPPKKQPRRRNGILQNALLHINTKLLPFLTIGDHCNKHLNCFQCMFGAQETLCCLRKRKKHCFLCIRNTLLSWKKKETLFSMHKQRKETLFSLSLAETTKCFLCTENSISFISFFCQDNKVFLVHRKQYFFLLPRQQSISYVQETVFLSFAKTTKCFLCIDNKVFLSFAETIKCFLCIENSVSFFCQDNKVFLVHRKQVFLSFAEK